MSGGIGGTKKASFILLALGPYSLPYEFSHAIVVAAYIPLSANPTLACDIIHSTIAGLQTAHPSALIIISDDSSTEPPPYRGGGV